ncbi:Major allergen Pyr c 1 [Linum perenne]
MGVITSETEISTRVPATRLFKTFVVDGDTIIPKIAPHAFKSFEILHGNGGPGTIKKIQFGEGGLQFFYQLSAAQFKYLKEKVEEINKDKMTYKYSVIEGDILPDLFDKITNEVKFLEDGSGSIIKTSRTYYTKDDIVVKGELIKDGDDKVFCLFKAIEAYLLENPED